MNFKPISIAIVAVLFITSSCSSNESIDSKDTKHLNQTGINLQTFEDSKVELKKLNILYQDLIKQYETLEDSNDEEWIEQNERTLASIIASHESWNADMEKQDEVILNAFEGGSMASGVVNQNRVVQIKARIQFYELLN